MLLCKFNSGEIMILRPYPLPSSFSYSSTCSSFALLLFSGHGFAKLKQVFCFTFSVWCYSFMYSPVCHPSATGCSELNEVSILLTITAHEVIPKGKSWGETRVTLGVICPKQVLSRLLCKSTRALHSHLNLDLGIKMGRQLAIAQGSCSLPSLPAARTGGLAKLSCLLINI